jgi:uncharacterized protein YcbX
MDTNAMRLDALYRYPVKGLSPEALTAAALPANGSLPADRLYAIENGPSGFDPTAPDHLPKIEYLMLMRNQRLARLDARYDEATTALTLRVAGDIAAHGRLDRPDGRAAIESFLASFCVDELRGPPRILTAPGWRFMDSRKGFVSLINLASVAALEERLGVPVDPLRFRGNLHVSGLEAFEEFDLVGRVLRIGPGVRVEITHRIDRCAATDVDPVSGLRDLNLVATLERAYGHHDCGVYARVLTGGTIAPGQRIMVEETDTSTRPPF